MPKSTNIAVIVGIFVVIALILLIGFSLRVSTGKFENEYTTVALFENATGLEEGTPVMLQGLEVGKVKALSFDEKQGKVAVELSVAGDVRLPEDSVATVEQNALLGQPQIQIRYGQSERSLPKDAPSVIPSQDQASMAEVMAQVADLGSELRQAISGFREGQQELTDKLSAVIDENRENIRVATDAMAKAGPQIEALSDKLSAALENENSSLNRILEDEQLYTDLQAISADLRAFTERMGNSEGLLTRLMEDPELAAKAEDSLDSIASAGRRMDEILAEKGPEISEALESLSNLGPKIDDSLSDFKEVAENLREITTRIESGEGTLGRLVNDPALYEDAQRTVNQVGESFEQSEEQGVIRSFLGLVFGAAI